jgi:hypothetical protein
MNANADTWIPLSAYLTKMVTTHNFLVKVASKPVSDELFVNERHLRKNYRGIVIMHKYVVEILFILFSKIKQTVILRVCLCEIINKTRKSHCGTVRFA